MSRPPQRMQKPNGVQRIDRFFAPVAQPQYWNGRPVNSGPFNQQSVSLTANPHPDPPMFAKSFRGPGGPRHRPPSSDQFPPVVPSHFRLPMSSYGNQPSSSSYRSPLQMNRPNMPGLNPAGLNRPPVQRFHRSPTSGPNAPASFQPPPRPVAGASHLMPNPSQSQRFTSSFQAKTPTHPFTINVASTSSRSSGWDNAGGFFVPDAASSQAHNFTSSTIPSQNTFRAAASTSAFPTAESFYNTGHSTDSTVASTANQPVFDVVDDDEEAGLLAALEEYESTQQTAPPTSGPLVPPSVPSTIPPVNSNFNDSIQVLDDDLGDVNWCEIMELEDKAGRQEAARPVEAEPRIQLPPPVVATNFAVAPHYPALARQPSAPMLRQQTLEEVQPEPIVILDEAPKDPQVPSHIRPLPGFDMEAGMTWLYPTNYPVRDYQYNIVQKALYKNTLVSLPTGLGKTFVAAVVMFNFYRWYPEGKVVFLAPTKPLVTQQHKACYQVMGIPQSDMVEMTGAMNPERRAALWTTKRVFFMTPQTAVNDLEHGAFLASDVRCLVIDEAHRATGAYAYVEIVRKVANQNKNFRVLALSATPGNDLAGIQIVLTNLRINQIEIRTDESLDIRQYVHKKTADKVVVQLDPQMRSICDLMFKVVSYYVDQLKKLHALASHIQPENLSKFQILQHSREFTAKTSVTGFMKQRTTTFFMTLNSLLHAYELLCNYGMRPFYRFVHATLRDGTSKHALPRSELQKNHDFNRLVQNVKDILGEDLTLIGDLDDPANTCNPHLDRPYVYGHPKLRMLETIVLKHFKPPARYSAVAFEGPSTSKGPAQHFGAGSPNQDSRIMIFTSYRESVHEIAELLRRSAPLVRVMPFVGQAATTGNKKGLNQKEQATVIERFRSGDYNVLVSTSVGEEGLDIGEVDLIICFDTQKSPIRSVQRTGRTGRKRAGKTIVLLTEGKEENNYKQCQTKKTYAAKTLLSTKYDMFKDIPRMVPEGLKPLCVQLKLENPAFEEEHLSGKFARKKSSKGELQTWLQKKVRTKESEKFEHKYLSDAESLEYNKYCKPLAEDVQTISVKPTLLNPRKITKSLKRLRTKEVQAYGVADPPLCLSNYTAWQIMRQPVSSFRHSARSQDFVTTMQQLEEFTAKSSGEKESSFKDDFTRWYKKAARAGYIDLDSEDDPGSSGESDGQDSRGGSPEIPFVPSAPLKRVSKRVIRPTKLCSLSTPQPIVPSPEAQPEEAAPSTTRQSSLQTVEEVPHETEDVDLAAQPLEDAGEDSSKVDSSLLTEDDTVINQPKTNPDVVEEAKPAEGLSQAEKEDIANLQMEDWETWNDPPKQPETDKQANISMLSINGALSFINRPSTSSSPEPRQRRVIVQETPVIPTTQSTNSQQNRLHEKNNLEINPPNFKLDFSAEVLPKKMTTEVITDDIFLSPLQPAFSRINDTFHPAGGGGNGGSGGGPLSYSTPRHDRTRRRLMVTPDISPVCDRTRSTAKQLNRFDETREFVPRAVSPMEQLQPRSSVSRVEGSIGDESDLDGEDLIPCSFPDETALRAEEEELLEEVKQRERQFEPTDSLDVEGLPVFVEIPPTLPFMAVAAESPMGEKEKKSGVEESISQEVGKMKLIDVSGGKVEEEKKGRGKEDVVAEMNASGSENRKMLVDDSVQCITPEKVARSKSPLKMSGLPNYSYDDVSRILVPRKKAVVAVSPESADRPCHPPRRSSGIGSSRSESSLKSPVMVKKRHRNPQQPFKSPFKQQGGAKDGSKRLASKKPPLVKPRLRALEFIDDQAEVSADHTCSSDEEEDELDQDTSSLIASQAPAEDPSYMRAIYAQALHRRDPTTDEVLGRHRKKVFNHSDIFSQPFVQDEDYGSSSFVSYSDDEEESPVKRKKLAGQDDSAKPTVAKGWKHDFQSRAKNRRK